MSSEYIRYDCITDEELKEDSVFVNVSNRKAAPLVIFYKSFRFSYCNYRSGGDASQGITVIDIFLPLK